MLRCLHAILLFTAYVILVAIAPDAAASDIDCHLPNNSVITTSKEDCKSKTGLILPSTQATVSPTSTSNSTDTGASKAPEERLEALKSLLEKGLITKDEAAAKRKAILDEM